jgi:hypothetical protein
MRACAIELLESLDAPLAAERPILEVTFAGGAS